MFRREGSRPRPAPRDGKTQSVRQCALPKPLANLLIHYSFHQRALHQFPLSQWLSCITKSAQKLSPRCNSRSESDRKLIIIIRFASGEEGRKPKTATQATSEIWSLGARSGAEPAPQALRHQDVRSGSMAAHQSRCAALKPSQLPG